MSSKPELEEGGLFEHLNETMATELVDQALGTLASYIAYHGGELRISNTGRKPEIVVELDGKVIRLAPAIGLTPEDDARLRLEADVMRAEAEEIESQPGLRPVSGDVLIAVKLQLEALKLMMGTECKLREEALSYQSPDNN